MKVTLPVRPPIMLQRGQLFNQRFTAQRREYAAQASTHSDQSLVDELPIVLTENGKLTRLALHRGMPHVRGVDRTHKVDARIILALLQYLEGCGVGGIGRRDFRI
ncbi:MAG: hypothetical protein WD080_05015 [Egibacteraceae bacterium]